MAYQRLRDLAEEESTYPIVVSFLDEEDNPVVPNALTWSLFKKNGEIVNGRDQIPVLPAFEVTILIYGDDLVLVHGETRLRMLLIEGDYDSNLGNNLPIRDAVHFTIADLMEVS